jgi:hypothetical protein
MDRRNHRDHNHHPGRGFAQPVKVIVQLPGFFLVTIKTI